MIVGITGGIGSGKSVVSQILGVLGYSVFNSDVESKNILQYNTEVKDKIIAKFGGDSFFGDLPNKPFIAEKIFNNKDNLNFLNQLIHPKVQKKFEEWCAQHQNQKILFKEAAILIETGAYKKLDQLILVKSDLEIRIERVMKRDGVTKDEVLNRMKNQLTDEEKIEYADFIIENSEKNSVIKQVLKILKELGETI